MSAPWRFGNIGAVKFYSLWQPPETEDLQTALVFGFFRHAPVALALQPWLADVLGRDVAVDPLAVDDFWPQFPSVVEGHERTEPELVFHADDGSPIVVIIEAKPGYGQHEEQQLSREVLDTVHAEDARRLVLIMVGADIGSPPEMPDWQAAVASTMSERGLADVQIEWHYSSWARLGRHIESCATADPAWSSYSDDVLTQLRLRGLLGYMGGPMFDDLEGLTVVNAVHAFNRTVLAARQFFLALVGQPRFAGLGLAPVGGKSFTMLRDDGSRALTQDEDYFQITTLMMPARKPTWADGSGV
jgi:hypothetical protein